MPAPIRADFQEVLDNIAVNDRIYCEYEGTITMDTYLSSPSIYFKFYGNTNLTFDSSAISRCWNHNDSSGLLSTFIVKVGASDGEGIAVGGQDWRITDITFNNDTSNIIEGVIASGTASTSHPRGVIDNCTFNNTRVLVQGSTTLMAHNRWFEASTLGTQDNVFIEDCEFNATIFENAVDSNYGGKYVFRYNVVNDTTVECHSMQADNRASRSWEIYENTINRVSRTLWTPIFLRGGTGVIWNNTVTGTWSQKTITFDNVRVNDATPLCGLCDGDSPCDSNEEAYGWLGRDQIGTGIDDWLWTDLNPYPPQAKDPTYIWGNVDESSNPLTVYIHNGCGNWIQENRDYYMIAKPAYTPYTYPHPLRSA